jgi:non-ribosomal peptide synthetase component F
MRYISSGRVIAAQLTTPAENPLLTDASRLIDVWFGGEAVRKQLFKKVTKAEQEAFAERLVARGFIRSGNLLLDPAAVLFAEMEHEIVGGIVTIGFQDNGKPVELKVGSKAFTELCTRLAGE